MGVTLVNTVYTHKPSDCMDLVELAHQVQRVCCHSILILESYFVTVNIVSGKS